MARYMTLFGYQKVPLGIFVVMELILAFAIRDNMFLMMQQMAFPSQWIKQWQEGVMELTTPESEIRMQDKTYQNWRNNFRSIKYQKHKPSGNNHSPMQ